MVGHSSLKKQTEMRLCAFTTSLHELWLQDAVERNCLLVKVGECISHPCFSSVFVNSTRQLYLPTVFINCTCQLHLSTVFLVQQDAFGQQCNCMQAEESIALRVNLQDVVNSVNVTLSVNSVNVTPSAINSVEEQKQLPVLLLAQTIV